MFTGFARALMGQSGVLGLLLGTAGSSLMLTSPGDRDTGGVANLSTRSIDGAPTFLDEMGRVYAKVPYADVARWKDRLTRERPGPAESARLHLRLGEVALGEKENPDLAAWHFRSAARLVKPASGDGPALALRLECGARRGNYSEAKRGFERLLKDGAASAEFPGFARNRASLWLRHLGARQAYRDRLTSIGIPQPERLDPNCGVRALQAALASVGGESSLKTLRDECRVGGFGSSMAELQQGAERLGHSAFSVKATEAGLKALPKPVVAFVQDDHFVAVSEADDTGVTYLCSDCGPALSGGMRLTWNQWRAMRPGAYLTVAGRGSDEEKAIASVLAEDSHRLRTVNIYSLRRSGSIKAMSKAARLAARLRRQVSYGAPLVSCASWPNTQRGGPEHEDFTHGDPVNLATGEEQYTPSPDLVVYNPIGPDVVWGRTYNSLGTNLGSTYEGGWSGSANPTYFGTGWSYTYNVGLRDPDIANVLQILRGVETIVYAAGNEAPGAGLDWEVLQNGTVVASSSFPNGWASSTQDSNYVALTPPPRSPVPQDSRLGGRTVRPWRARNST